jgi:hypothetical protein
VPCQNTSRTTIYESNEKSYPAEPFPPDNPLFNVPFDSGFTFGSEAANLEYSILSAILGNPSPPDSANTPPPQQQFPQANTAWPTEFAANVYDGAAYGDQQQMAIQPSDTLMGATYPSPQFPPAQYPQTYQQSPEQQQQPPLHPLQPRWPIDLSAPSNGASTSFVPSVPKELPNNNSNLMTPPTSTSSPTSTSTASLLIPTQPLPPSYSQLQSINDRVTCPYDYTEGYHFLMKHLPSR